MQKQRASKTNAASGYVPPAIGRAFRLLRLVADAEKALSISDIARRLELSKSTTLGLVRALIDTGALDQDAPGQKIFLGADIFELTLKSGQYTALRQITKPVIERLCTTINETVFLGINSLSGSVIIDAAEPAKPLKISAPAGTAIPLLAGALGKLLLARLDARQAKKIISKIGLPRYTANTIVDEIPYMETLKQVRRQGYALDNEEYLKGVRAVAVALGRYRGLPLAIWVVGFSTAMPDERMPDIIQQTLANAATIKAAPGFSC
jgi:DNA-binding IclR family transcriptional regulator